MERSYGNDRMVYLGIYYYYNFIYLLFIYLFVFFFKEDFGHLTRVTYYS